jgi:hypothetical protein
MQISLNKKFTSISRLSGGIKNNAAPVFWLILAVIIVLEVLVLVNAVKIILNTQTPSYYKPSSGGVRINFVDYEKNIQRIQNAGSFTPSPEAGADPFTGIKKSGFGLSAAASSTLATTSPDSVSATGTVY